MKFSNIPLRQISIDLNDTDINEYPFSVNTIRGFKTLDVNKNVTLLVGENGSGKSTFLEALSIHLDLPVIGRSSLSDDDTLDNVRPLSDKLRLVWNRKVRNGFFMRTEDFFNFSIKLKEKQEDFDKLAKEYDETLTGYGRDLAMGTTLAQKNALNNKYKGNLDNMSHGEAFLHLFSERISRAGIYILDEPEAPLSPSRQLTLISIIKEASKNGCQFIIATHSPILLAFPEANIYSFDELTPKKVFFDDIEHVNLTRDFLNDPKSFLRHL
ncbi:MAG: ATPase [Candidatus Muiribacterium halophilum]|uniref:ATPase n=1 Tax=Muiribacterium halophilum TaxID=2053465 RepID=A0A2N5ZHC6_MUIH1|nr:MAG: ATPase [Candidatus Muirbacterium halophilum]